MAVNTDALNQPTLGQILEAYARAVMKPLASNARVLRVGFRHHHEDCIQGCEEGWLVTDTAWRQCLCNEIVLVRDDQIRVVTPRKPPRRRRKRERRR